VDPRRVLEEHQLLALAALVAVLGRNCGAVGEQPASEVGVDPGPRHDPRAVRGPTLVS
jgi:hypothetical protein